DQRKDEFLATLAHELRNPLAPISNALQVLEMQGFSDPRIAQVGEVMQRQVRHMTRLVDDLLDVSRITQGRIELKKEDVLLDQVIESAIETSQPLIDQGGHAFTVTMPGSPVRLTGDGTRLSQVFSNLLNNAAKYTEPGGSIFLDVSLDGPWVRAVVRD